MPAERRGSLPWAEMMAVGFGLLRLSPRAFWAMTPRELSAAMGAFGPSATPAFALTRADLDTLMQRYPDRNPTGVINDR